jgi:hypothetical protein
MLQAVELTPEQINQLIQFINEGKYSWTCVLFLRFLGENPQVMSINDKLT